MQVQFVVGWVVVVLSISQIFRPRPMDTGGDHQVSDGAVRFFVLGCCWQPKQEHATSLRIGVKKCRRRRAYHVSR